MYVLTINNIHASPRLCATARLVAAAATSKCCYAGTDKETMDAVYLMESSVAEAILRRMSATLEMRNDFSVLLERSKVG